MPNYTVKLAGDRFYAKLKQVDYLKTQNYPCTFKDVIRKTRPSSNDFQFLLPKRELKQHAAY